MKKITIWLLIAALLMTGCVPALAAAGDRTLVHFGNSDGFSQNYIANVFLTDAGVTAYLNGQQQKLAVYPEGGEPVEYLLESENPTAEQIMSEEGYTTTQTMGWFTWKGELYALQYNQIQQQESSEIEGGFVRKARLADGRVTTEESDVPQLDWDNMVEDYGDWKSVRYLNRLLVSGDRLIGTTWDNNGSMILIAFDLTTGGAEEIPMQDMDSIYPGPDGSLLLTRWEWGEEVKIHVIRFDLDSQSEEEIGVVSFTDGQLQSLCLDEKTNTLYYVLNGEIYAAKDLDLTAAEPVSDCPLVYDTTCTMLEDGRMLLWNSTAIVLRNLDPAAKGENFTLTIQDYSYSEPLMDANYAFTDARGDASVVIKRGGDSSNILQAMMNRDASVDIYSLNYESSEFEALKNRGFLADLGGNATISAATDRMVPYVQDAVRQDGKIIAVPMELYGYMFGYSVDAWKKLGGTEEELPKTWGQFLDWLGTLPAKLEGSNYVLFDAWVDREMFRQNMINTLLNQYQAYLNEGGHEYAFNTPLLRGLLEKMNDLDYDALGLPEPVQDEDGGSMSYDDGGKMALMQMNMQATVGSWGNEAAPLILAVEEGTEPILPVNMRVAFVNPYSEHAEAAAEYLSLSLKSLPTTSQYSLFTDKKEPIRDPYYEENQKNLNEWLEQAKANLEKAEEDERPQWEEAVKDYEAALTDLEKNSWMISQDAIDAYAARLGWLRVLNYDFTNALVSNENGGSDYWTMLWGYVQKQVSAEELLSGIDKKVQMMRLEGN